MKTCSHCGEPLEAGWQRCPACSSSIQSENTCSGCGQSLKSHWTLCPVCSTPVGSARPPFQDSDFPSPASPLLSDPGGADAASQAMSVQPELEPGTELRDFRIESLLGKGASSAVYKAHHTLLDEPVALKVVAAFSEKHPLLEAYRDEYKAQLGVSNKKHILHIEAPLLCAHQGLNWLMLPMELARESLRDWMRRHPVGDETRLEQGLELFAQACQGVQAIHEAGLVHLDIKPENLLLSGDEKAPTLKVADFGLTRSMMSRGQRAGLFGDGIGTPAYMAPEQILPARWKDVGKEADIYALGMILYELLDGDLPYSGSAKQIKEKKRDTTITITPPQGPQPLGEAAMVCLEREKGKRPASAKELMELVEKNYRLTQEHQKNRQKAQELLARAEQELKRGELGQAKKLLQQADELDPNNDAITGLLAEVQKQIALQEEQRRKEEERIQQEAEERRRKQEAERMRREEEERKRKQKEEERRRKAEQAEQKRKAEQQRKKREEEERGKLLTGELVFVEGGTFMMGSEDGWSREKPVHQVELDDFYIGKYPVTQAQWKAVMGSNPSHFKGDDRPVESVSWEDAQGFIRKLSELTGKTFRLPTEAEWEYAARGGQKSRGYTYAGSDNLHDVGWFGENSGDQTQPVGRKRPNELGIYDMSGNVWEWCSDWYDDDYYKKSPRRNPQGPSSGSCRLYRGGGWNYRADYCRCSYRYISCDPGYRNCYLGFRLACSFS